MDLFRLKKRIEQYLGNTGKPDDHQLLDHWLDALADESTYEVTTDPAEQEKIRQRIFKRVAAQTRPAPKNIFFRPWMKVAAALIPLFIAGLFLTNYLSKPKQLTYYTALGEVKEIRLPDGSVVTLKPHSQLTFPEQFGNHREVTLKGSAFFEVKRNPEKPFSVQVKTATVQVLGTSFEVKAFEKLPTLTVAVRTGKVKVADTTHTLGILTPNQQLEYNTQTAQTTIHSIETSDYLKNGNGLAFDKVSLREILVTLENHYPVEFDIQTDQEVILSGSFHSRMTMDQIIDVLNTLTQRYQIHITKQNNKQYLVK